MGMPRCDSACAPRGGHRKSESWARQVGDIVNEEDEQRGSSQAVSERRRVRDKAWRSVRTSLCSGWEAVVQRLDFISKAIEKSLKDF